MFHVLSKLLDVAIAPLAWAIALSLAAVAFRAAGLEVDVLPVDHRHGRRSPTLLPRADALDRSTAAIRKLVGRLVYRMAGYAGA